jgi:hypothetical protein
LKCRDISLMPIKASFSSRDAPDGTEVFDLGAVDMSRSIRMVCVSLP